MVFSANLNAEIKIGRDFQAEIPDIDEFEGDCIEVDASQCLWDPKESPLTDEHLNTYLEYAQTKGHDEFSALCILNVSNMNTERAISLIDEFAPSKINDKWSEQESCLFKTAYATVGKNFSSMKSLFYNKTVNEIVELYYFLKAKKQIMSPKETSNKRKVFPDSVLTLTKQHPFNSDVLNLDDIGERIVNSGSEVNLDINDHEQEIVDLKKEMIDMNKKITNMKKQWQELKNTRKLVVDSTVKDGGYLALDKAGELCFKEEKETVKTYRWDPHEIVHLRMGVTEFGRDWKKLGSIIKTKTSCQLKMFFEENYERLNFVEDYAKHLSSRNGSKKEVYEIPKGDSGNVVKSTSLGDQDNDPKDAEFVPSNADLTEIVEMEESDDGIL